MSIIDFFIILAAFLFGLIVAYLFFRARVSVFEERARNDLERWKLECINDIRKDSVNRSRSTLKGRISEQMGPLLPEFNFAPAENAEPCTQCVHISSQPYSYSTGIA